MDALPAQTKRREHRIHCEFGHVRRPADGPDTSRCPQCIERRIRARTELGLPCQHLFALLRVVDPSGTAGMEAPSAGTSHRPRPEDDEHQEGPNLPQIVAAVLGR